MAIAAVVIVGLVGQYSYHAKANASVSPGPEQASWPLQIPGIFIARY